MVAVAVVSWRSRWLHRSVTNTPGSCLRWACSVRATPPRAGRRSRDSFVVRPRSRLRNGYSANRVPSVVSSRIGAAVCGVAFRRLSRSDARRSGARRRLDGDRRDFYREAAATSARAALRRCRRNAPLARDPKLIATTLTCMALVNGQLRDERLPHRDRRASPRVTPR